MIEFYEYDGDGYEYVGAIEDGKVVEGDDDLNFIFDFIDETDGLSVDDEDAIVDRVSNEYFMGVIPP